MKKLIDNIVRGGKTLNYLAVALFALAAAQTARAVDSLEETGGNVTTSAQLAFKDVALKDVGTMYALRARMQGGWFDDDGVEGTFFNRQETRENGVLVKVTYQFHAIDGSSVKVATIEFTEGEGGVYVKRATGTNSGNLNTFGTEPFTAGSASGDYVPYDLKLVEPVVRSINVNFSNGNNLNTTSSVRYGAGDYAVPYTDWYNMSAGNGTATVKGATVKTTNVKNAYQCSDLSSAKDVRHGYLDDGNTTPTVTVTGVPYASYRVVVYVATDNADVKFGYVTINGTDYKGDTDSTVEGNTIWGATGAANKAKGLREGVNYLVSPVLTGSTATIVGHKMSGARGCIAAFQIVEVVTGTYTATIDAAGTENFSTLSWDTALPASLAGSKLVVNVEEDATLNIDSTVEASAVEFNVASGKTLTLSGNAITVGAIAVKGAGQVVVGSASQLAGTLRGNGTVVYDGFRPTGATFTDQAWTGTVWVKNISTSNSDRIDFALQNYGNAGSTLRFSNVNLYFPNNTTTAFPGTVDLEDVNGVGMNVCDGYGGSVATMARLTGTGTLSTGGGSSNGNGLTINDASGFAGTFNLTKYKVIVGTATGTSASGVMIVESGAMATVAAGKAWSAAGGITVDGTLVLDGSNTGIPTVTGGSGTIVCNDKLPNNSGLAANTWTGLVEVNGGATTAAGIAAANAASFMNASSTFTVATGTVVLGSGAGLTGEVNVLSGATLTVVDDSTTALALDFGTLEGNVNLAACSALETLTLGLDSYRGSGIVYPSALQTLNLSLSETLAEDGEISVPVNSASGATIAATITDQNGETKAGTVAVSGTTATITFAPAISGKACWCAYEMDYESGNAAKTGFENTGSDTVPLNSDSGIAGDNAFYNGMLYTYAHPWRDMKNDNVYPDTWTAVVRCTVPEYEDAAVITFGTQGTGLIGLVAGHDPETEMRLVQTTGNSHYVTNATMTVKDATTAQHVYIFSVETNQTVKVYCDGELVLDKTFESRFTIGSGIQIGSVHGGVGNTAIVRFAKNESPAKDLDETVQKNARIDCVRLYKGVLGPNAVRQLSVEFPAVKLFRATVAEGATTDWDSLSWSPAWDGGNEYSKIILTTAGDATLTLPSSVTAADFEIDIASGSVLTLAKAAGGTTFTLGNPMEVNDGTLAVTELLGFGNEIGGTGALRLGNGVVVARALSGTAKVDIPSGATVAVIGGSIANTITGAGVLGFTDVPSALSFGTWTGTVYLPNISSSGENGLNLNNYGVSGSTVQLAGISSGVWLANATVSPTVDLVGNMPLNAFSASFANTINKLTGSGAFSLAADGTAEGYANGYFLLTDVSEFTGSIAVAKPGLALGGSAKPSSTEWYGKIVVQVPVTVGAGATWSAENGIVLASADATLTVPSGATAPAPTSGVAGYEVWTSTRGGATTYSLVSATTDTPEPVSYGEEGEKTTINVPRGWAQSHGVTSAAGLVETGANGLKYVESYALGLDPNREDAKPMVGMEMSGDGIEFSLANVAIPVGVTLTVKVISTTSLDDPFAEVEGKSMTVVGDGSAPSDTITVDLNTAESARFYRLSIAISGTTAP